MKGRLTMSTVTRTAIESAAAPILDDRIEVDIDTVAGALAQEIINEHIDVLDPCEPVEAGIKAAIDEIDDATFGFAVDVIRDRVADEVESQAKAIALRMLRETAAKAESAAAMTAD
jgi:hypothetical protein